MSKVLKKFIHRIKEKGIVDTIGLLWNIGTGLIDFYLNPFAKKQSKLTRLDYKKIKERFELSGIEVISYKINVAEFQKWLNEADFPESYRNSYSDVFIEKALENYVGARLLELSKEDILIDVAAGSSPWFEIAERMYGCTAYALDLAFPKGINGKKIGADATNMPLPDGFATKMWLYTVPMRCLKVMRI